MKVVKTMEREKELSSRTTGARVEKEKVALRKEKERVRKEK